MNNNSTTDLDHLVSRLLDGQLSNAEAALLNKLLSDSPGAVERYRELLDNHEALCAIHPGEVYVSSFGPAELPPRAGSVQAGANSSSRIRWYCGLAASVAFIVILGVFWWRLNREPQTAVLTDLQGALCWTGDGGEVCTDLNPGKRLDGGTLECLYADSWGEIRFHDGTTLTISGRSVLTISRGKQKELYLREGSLSANVAPQPKTYPLLIHTPTARFEVLGTQFDVVANPSSSDLSVTEGLVLVTRLLDGSVATVPAKHQVKVSADVHVEFSVLPSLASVASWQSRLPEDAIHGQWLPELGGNVMGLRATPLLRPEGECCPVAVYLAAGSVSHQPPVSLHQGATLHIHGKNDTPPNLTIGITVQNPKGGFAGKYVATPEAKNFPARGGFFDVAVPVADFTPDNAHFPNSPIGMELRDWWCSTGNADAGLSIMQVEVVPPPQK